MPNHILRVSSWTCLRHIMCLRQHGLTNNAKVTPQDRFHPAGRLLTADYSNRSADRTARPSAVDRIRCTITLLTAAEPVIRWSHSRRSIVVDIGNHTEKGRRICTGSCRIRRLPNPIFSYYSIEYSDGHDSGQAWLIDKRLQEFFERLENVA